MTEKKILSLTKVINALKDNHPDLPYDLLPGLNIKLDPKCIDKSDDIKDLKEGIKLLKFPILEPIKVVIQNLIDEKAKLPKPNPRVEKLMQLLAEEQKKEGGENMEIEPSTSTNKRKRDESESEDPKKVAVSVITKKKQKNKKTKSGKKIKSFDPSDLIASKQSVLIFNNSVKWWHPYNKLDDGRIDPLCFDGKECKKETNQWNGEKEIACKQLNKEKCNFRMNINAFLKFKDYMEELGAIFWPIPKCSCSNEKVAAKNKIAVRGSSAKAEVFKMWYYCEDCRTTFYFSEYEKKIQKVLLSQPQLVQEEEADTDEDESDTEVNEMDVQDESSEDEDENGS